MSDPRLDPRFEFWTMWPEWAKDAIHVDVEIALDWRDLLLLIYRRGKMRVHVKTFIVEPYRSQLESLSRVHIDRIHWPWEPKVLGVMDVGGECEP